MKDLPKQGLFDRGLEFVSLRAYFEKLGIEPIYSFSSNKLAKIERFNLTIETKIFKYLTAHNTKRYSDKLADLVYAYNHTPSRALYGYTPYQAYTDESIIKILIKKFAEKVKIYEKKYKTVPKFVIGQKVRISKDIGAFDRGYIRI